MQGYHKYHYYLKVAWDLCECEDITIGVDEDGLMWFSCQDLQCCPDDFFGYGSGKTAEAINITKERGTKKCRSQGWSGTGWAAALQLIGQAFTI